VFKVLHEFHDFAAEFFLGGLFVAHHLEPRSRAGCGVDLGQVFNQPVDLEIVRHYKYSNVGTPVYIIYMIAKELLK
jgi:hypothetical protein